jgi:hypothetical protein
VVTRGSGERGRVAAGIAGKIYKGLEYRFGSTGNRNDNVAATPASLTPRPKLDAKAAAALSDEEEGDTGEGAGGVTTDSLPSTSGASKNKSVIMTAPARQTEVTTRPATSAPYSQPQQGGTTSEQRPRRVLTNKP